VEQQVDVLLHHTMDSLGRLKSKDVTTAILSMAKIVKNVREAKRRRKINKCIYKYSVATEKKPLD
jgi:hypothetical protein